MIDNDIPVGDICDGCGEEVSVFELSDELLCEKCRAKYNEDEFDR